MSEVTGILRVDQPRAGVQLTPGRREMRRRGRHSGDTGASRDGRLSPMGSVSSVINALTDSDISK